MLSDPFPHDRLLCLSYPGEGGRVVFSGAPQVQVMSALWYGQRHHRGRLRLSDPATWPGVKATITISGKKDRNVYNVRDGDYLLYVAKINGVNFSLMFFKTWNRYMTMIL